MQRRRRNRIEWPAWWFNLDGESQLFEKAEDVPEGWTPKPPAVLYEIKEQSLTIDKEKVIKQLEEFGVSVDPRWGAAKLHATLRELTND